MEKMTMQQVFAFVYYVGFYNAVIAKRTPATTITVKLGNSRAS